MKKSLLALIIPLIMAAFGFVAFVPIAAQAQTTTSATLSLDAATPLASSVAVTNTSAGSYLGLPVLVFDVSAQGGPLTLNSLSASFSPSYIGPLAVAYLYQGSTLIASAGVVNIPNPTANFGKFSSITIPAGTTVPLTIKVDVSNVSGNGFTVSSAINPIAVGLNSNGNSIVPTGSAQGNPITVLGQGLNLSISGTPTISQVANSNQFGNTTETYTAAFNVVAQAVGESVTFGLPNSSQPSFIAQIYENGSQANPSPIVTALYSAPTNTTISTNGTQFTLGQNQSVTIPVTYSWTLQNPGANVYGMELVSAVTSVGTTNIGACTPGFSSCGTSSTPPITTPPVTTTPPITSSCYQFNNNLTIGSRGADVTALQTWLINQGYAIPLISSGQAAKGYFGPSTSAALGRYQATVGLPATGVLDAATRSNINKSCGTSTPPITFTCPVGFTCAPTNPNPVTPVCPAGYVCEPVTTNPISSNQPTITGVCALAAGNDEVYAGERFCIQGTNFSAPDSVYVQNQPATVTQDGNNLIWALAPSNLTSGASNVYVTNSNGTSNQFSVTVFGSTSVCPTGYTCAPTTNPTQPVTGTFPNNGTLSVNLLDANSDKVGTFGDFGPGTGINNKTPYDWHWSANVSLPVGETVAYARLVANDGWEGWATRSTKETVYPFNGEFYPLVIFMNGQQMDTAYDQQWNIPTGATTLDLYGQPEAAVGTPFPGGTLQIVFTDQTSLTATIPASSITVPPGPTTPITTATCPAGYICAVPGSSNNCPVGYTCTPTSINCPSGYYCWTAVMTTTTQPSITITSPNGGQTFAYATAIPVSWSMNYNSSSVYICLYSPTSGCVFTSPLLSGTSGGDQYTISSTVVNAIPTSGGQYKVNVCDNNQSPAGLSGKSLCSLSANYFTISGSIQAPATSQQSPTVTSVSPASGPLGTTVTLTGTGFSQQSNTIFLQTQGNVSLGNAIVASPNGTTLTFTVPTQYAVSGPLTITVNNNVGNTTANFTITPASPTTVPTVPASPSSVSAAIVDASSDKAGTTGVFGPGQSINYSNPYDWHWSATVTMPGPETIQSILVSTPSNHQYWSTANSSYYPLIVFNESKGTGQQVDTAYGQTIGSFGSAGSVQFDLYGQPEVPAGTAFPGGTITVTFTDGTTATASIPASSVSIPAVQTANSAAAINASDVAGYQAVGQLCDQTHWVACFGF